MPYPLRSEKASLIRSVSIYFTLIIFFLLSFGAIAQQSQVVDFLRVEAEITPKISQKKVSGDVKYIFRILQNTDSIYLDAHKMKIIDYESKQIRLDATEDKIWIISKFQSGKEYSISFQYEAMPTQTFYFMPDGEMWTQGQGKYTSHWLPSIDDTNEKIEFDLFIITSKDQMAIANGRLIDVQKEEETQKWQFDMDHPMSSYLVAVAIGRFEKKELTSSSKIPLELYYNPEDSLKIEPTYRYSKQIFDFLESEIGVAYPWGIYKQVPLRDFLYAGMENTSATFFSEAFMVDSIGFNDRNYINVNAHELAHQWFGNMVTAKADKDHWLQEGFATYYALLAEQEIFGEEYFYWQLFQTAEQLKASSDEGKGESLLNPKASSLTFYQKGAWALHILRELIGEKDFRAAIKNYLEKYQFQNASSDDFLGEVKAISKIDISNFERDWLHQSAFKAEEAYQSLMKSPFMNEYFKISALRATPFSEKKMELKSALTFPNDFIGQEAVFQLAAEPISETTPLYKIALQSNNLYVRQAVALSLQEIPDSLVKEYEGLLSDDSYVTIEMAMYQLYMQFPSKKKFVLERTRNIMGFQNRNIRQLWLALALITEGFDDSQKPGYLKELREYSLEGYSFEIREKAFEYISELGLWNSETLKSLVEATAHPNWRFAKSSKKLLGQIMETPKYSEILKNLKSTVSNKASDNLDSLLKE